MTAAPNEPRFSQTKAAKQAEDSAGRRSADESLRHRAARILESEIDFIPNRAFAAAGAEQEIGPELSATCAKASRDTNLPGDLPSHLARLCESKLLSAPEEARLFRRMNFLKFKAACVRDELETAQPDAELVERAERYLEEAEAIRDRIVKSNMRLVMSVVKKFVTPQHSFDDMLSEGIYSLIQATEKFDYDRGFRFSTYAYRAISRNAYRSITDWQRENARFATKQEEGAVDTAEDRGSSSAADEVWDRQRGLLAQLMGRLDRREQFIIRSRYALGAHRKVRTFQCLADKLGVSKERVRQLEQRAVSKLQSFAAEQQIDEVVGAAFS